jgi:hypothetical protein
MPALQEILGYFLNWKSLTAFFNPRLQQWSDHFRREEGIIMPLTPEGRVTAKILQFNLLERILERKQLGSIK